MLLDISFLLMHMNTNLDNKMLCGSILQEYSAFFVVAQNNLESIRGQYSYG